MGLCVTNITSSGLDGWIYWHCYYNYIELQSIITAHNRWLSKTRSIPSWTTSVFSSTVTDLVPIYESVTSSASVVRWLTLHSWTLNFGILFRLIWTTTNLRMNWLTTPVRLLLFADKPVNSLAGKLLFYNSNRTKDRTLPLTVHAILLVSIPWQRPVVMDMCLANSVSEPMPSNQEGILLLTA
jgi:hypothetical protein